MADKKISELTNITGANLADVDEFVVVDTSASETKAITRSELASGLVTASTVTSAGALMDSELTDITAVKALNQGVATTDDPTFTNTQLAAIAAEKAVTAVDVFVYDTSKDSDGGAWRKRTQHTSWYNETLNTATRGSRREFPAVAVIVADAVNSKVTIYDGDDPSLPMWMVFNASWSLSAGTMLTLALYAQSPMTSGYMLNGKLAVGSANPSNNVCGLHLIDFIQDRAELRGSSYNSHTLHNGIAERNVGRGIGSHTELPALVSGKINDVAMTVLPDAPIDPATGLPVPTIAVATAGGVSVIKDDGTVVDGGVGSVIINIDFTKDGTLSAHLGDYFLYLPDPVWRTDGFSIFNSYYRMGVDIGVSGASVSSILLQDSARHSVGSNGGLVRSLLSGTNLRLVSGAHDRVSARITSTYNTGWMPGDIKGAFLSDTDDTDLVGGANIISDTSMYPLALSTGNIHTNTSANLVAGNFYRVQFQVQWSADASGSVAIYATTTGLPYLSIAADPSNTTTLDYVVKAEDSGYVFGINAGPLSAGTATIVSPSVSVASADRSVNNNGLIVNGTVTRSPVATGAELVAYSGFSASNYLEQPYNSDLDFGTGDFCVMFWIKNTGATDRIVNRQSASAFWNVKVNPSGYLAVDFLGSTGLTTTAPINLGVWQYVTLVRTDGVFYGYVDGVLVGSVANTLNFTDTDAILTVGRDFSGIEPLANGSLALLRISATAPTAEQIKKIYEDEKVLFQENAACTLYGASDAVTALAHDPVTDLLHVGTSAGRSVFQGLRRVSNTTTAVGTAISASNSLVVEE